MPLSRGSSVVFPVSTAIESISNGGDCTSRSPTVSRCRPVPSPLQRIWNRPEPRLRITGLRIAPSVRASGRPTPSSRIAVTAPVGGNLTAIIGGTANQNELQSTYL